MTKKKGKGSNLINWKEMEEQDQNYFFKNKHKIR